MLIPKIPAAEEARLAALHALKILDTAPEERFERVVRIASRLFEVPIALVSLVDAERQWFKACYGLDADSTSRDISFCGHAIHKSEIFVVEDATKDERFADNPLVVGEPGIRFYAGRPLAAPDGSLIGTLCLIDRVARSFGKGDMDALDDLAQMVETELAQMRMAELQRDLAQSLSQRAAAEAMLVERQRDLVESRAALQRTLRDEEGMGRLRGRIIAATDHAKLQEVVERDLLREMRDFGLPVFAISVQLPSERAGYFIDAKNLVENLLVERYITPIAKYPWVGEAWTAQRPIIVGKERLQAVGELDSDLCSLVEVPLPGEGSMGISSTERDTFSEEALRHIRRWANLFDFSDYRRIVAEEYRRRIELVDERVHRAILQMTQVEDFARVVGAIGKELRGLQADFEGVGVNIIDEEEEALYSYNYIDGEVVAKRNPLAHATNQKLLACWRRREVWERAVDVAAGDMVDWQLDSSYVPSLVIDVPFAQGTLAVGLRADLDCSTTLIALMRALCDQLSLGYKRLLDIKERQRAEEEMRLARDEAQAASKAKSEFLANMSHELRTPMNAILGMTDLVLDTELQEEQRNSLGIVQSAANALLEILNDILDLSKIEAGKLELEWIDFSLRELLEQLVQLVRYRAEEKGLDFYCDVEGIAVDRLVGDPGRLRQIVLNLVGNAVKFTQAGQVAIEAQSREKNGGVEVEIKVADTGIGIPEQKQQAIFAAFTQADSSITRRYGGTGLGLNICSQLVQMMGGQIGLNSREGEGSTFYFTVQLKKKTLQPALAAVDSLVATRESWDGLRALVVEDNVFNQALVRGLLAKKGWEVEIVESGELALEYLRTGDCDIVLMDIEMAAMDGLQTTAAVREYERQRGGHVPIIGLTAHVMQGDRERCLRAGMDGYVAKPIRMGELFSEIERVLAPAQ